MIARFVRHGTGSAAAAADYLLADRDHAGEKRDQVEVLRGDPHQVAQVADTCGHQHRYRSAVLAWAPEDNPTAAQIDQAVDRFQELAWAGIDADRYAWSAILHRHQAPSKGVHVHVLTARVDLETGRSFNIAPPGWQRDFRTLERALNTEHGWARPDDPARARLTRPETFPGRRAETRAALGRYLEGGVARGIIRNRGDVIATLEDAGLDVTRQGEHYITVREPKSGERWRLKGALYERDWTTPEPPRGQDARAGEAGGRAVRGAPPARSAPDEAGTAQAGSDCGRGTAPDRRGSGEEAAQARRNFEAVVQRRARAHRESPTAHSEQLVKRSEDLAEQHENERRQWARERDDLAASVESLSGAVATLNGRVDSLLTAYERQAEDYAQLEAALNAIVQASTGR